MADGEEKAIFVGLRNDAQESLPSAAKHVSSFGEDTAGKMDASLGKHAANEADQEQNLLNAGKRPADETPDPRPTKTPKTNAGTEGAPEGDVTDAGVGSGGASSAESGATDPVDVVSGQLLETVVDLSLPGILPLVLRRAYMSAYQHGGLFGPGWASTLDVRLEVDEQGAVKFLGDDAQCLDYGVPVGLGLGLPSYPEYGARWALAREASGSGGGWTVTDSQAGLVYGFASEGSVRPLLAISDRAGNEIRILRDQAGLPVGIAHSGGYRITVGLEETPAGIRAVSYALEPAAEGREDPARLVGFEYDATGRLVSVLDSTDAAHCYEYDDADRVCAWIDKAGYRYPYRYDAQGRVVETGVAGGHKHALIAYDPVARATSVTDSLGNTSVFRYDRFQQITSITDPYGATTKLRKDAYGRLVEHTTPLGHVTSFDYDHDGNRTKITYPDGQSVAMSFHGPGLVSRIDLPDGAVWRYEYDERGNPVTEVDPLGGVTRFTHDARGAVIAVTAPLGAVQRYELNAAGLPIASIDPAGSRTELARDVQGRLISLRTPDGALATFERDSEGRVIAQSAADGAVTRYAYDVAGNRSVITDPSGRTTRIEYGPFYTPTARTNPDGNRYVFGHDAELRLTTVTGPTGLAWRYEYDGNGQRIAETDFDGREQRYAFDADGRLVEHIAPDGQTTIYSRDSAGRLTGLSADNEAAEFGYDKVGRLVRAVNRQATVLIARDLLGRTIREEINGQAVTRTFDAAGNLTERTTPAGQHSLWAYDVLGEAASLTAGDETLTFTRDVLGREVRRELGAFALTQGYDVVGQLTTQQLTSSGRVLQERDYGYDQDGLPVRVHDLLRGTRVMDLDPVGQVTAVRHGDVAERYAYDAIGNLAASQIPSMPAESVHAGALGDHATVGTRTTRAGRTEYTYDARGRLAAKTRRTLSGQKLTWSYAWNARDRLVGVTRPDGQNWSYRYDALGRRIQKSLTSPDGQAAEIVEFGWDGATLIEQTTHRPDAPTVTVTWDYEPGTAGPAAQRRSVEPAVAGRPPQGSQPGQEQIDAEFWAIVTDLTGTPQELVSRDGSIVWTAHTPLWGARADLGIQTTDEPGCPIGFPGQYHDPETGLYYNNQRYYDPDTAAYLSPDPIGLDAGQNPQRYVANPIAAIDPLGLTPQGPNPRMKTDDELQADADAIREGFKAHGKAAYNNRVVATYQAEDGSLYYSVNSSKSYKGMDDFAKNLGYKRISGKGMEGPEQTDAEQILLNGVDKKVVPDSGRVATTQVPCGEFRNSGKVAQNCAKRLAGYVPKIRLVGRYASGG